MADEDNFVIGSINYWCRRKHYRQMQKVAVEAQRKYANDAVLKYFTALGMILEGRQQEGMRELDGLTTKQDVNLCSMLTLIHTHRMAQSVDQEAITLLESQLKTERRTGSDKSLYFAGLFLVHIGKYERAREYIDRALKQNSKSSKTLALKGWLEMLGGDEAASKKAVKFFDEALAVDGVNKCPDALFGKTFYFEQRRNYSQALDVTSQTIVAFPKFLPGFIEKMRQQLALQDWDQTVDTAQRALEINPHCLQARCYVILQLLCKEGNYSEAVRELEKLRKNFDSEEPQNAELHHEFARVFCRVSGRNPSVLQQTYLCEEKANTINPNSSDYTAELGYELMVAGKPKDAMKCFRNALKTDETSQFALCGVLNCQLLENQLDDAAAQLEFLSELKEMVGTSAELVYLQALLNIKQNKPSDKTLKLLNKALETHLQSLKGLPLGTDYFLALNPIFLTQIITDYLTFAPQLPLTKTQPPNSVLQHCLQVLEPLCKAMPGLLEAQYLMAKAKFLSGDVDGAAGLLSHCLERDNTSSDCHVLMSQIHLHANNFKAANQSLEVGLSHNFEVREHPLYHLIKARILKRQGDLQEAVKTLRQAMQLPGVKNFGSSASVAGKKSSSRISVNDCVSLYIELADTHRLLGEQPEAAKVMQDALAAFHGTGEESRITIANVDLSLARGDVTGALETLRAIGPDQPYFIQAREKMADIYLNERKDKRLYAACYRELAEKYPSRETVLLLGDAYTRIQEHEKAIEVYEFELKKNPKDAVLAKKIGESLIKTHQFGKAISYYEAALKQGGKPFLRYDLADLLLRLKQYDKAEKVLKQALEQHPAEQGAGVETLSELARYHALLADVYEHQGRHEERLQHLVKAKDVEDRVVMRSTVEQPESLGAERKFATTVCSKLAHLQVLHQNKEAAIQCYKDALAHSDGDGKVTLELAKLYAMNDDLDTCHQLCAGLVRENKEKEAASCIMADLLFRKNQADQATAYFQQVLQEKPNQYSALARLIEFLRRTGKLEEGKKYLDSAESSSGRAALDAGFNYCQGLHERYLGNPNTALKYFNKARKDSEFGSLSTYNMVEICLNPDNETIGGELFEGSETEAGDADVKHASEKAALKTADNLLRDFRPKAGDYRHKVLSNMLLVATKNRTNVEHAVGNFATLAKVGIENVGVSYGSALALINLKQQQKAVELLKHLATYPWSLDDGEYLEASWLLLTDNYITSSDLPAAQDLITRCLQYNKSCYKAYEYLGYLYDRQQGRETEAAQNYELAWRYSNKNNPAIGYKLAFNYLKTKKYFDAIDICHHVLGSHPQYPKIKKEILDKARLSLRV